MRARWGEKIAFGRLAGSVPLRSTPLARLVKLYADFYRKIIRRLTVRKGKPLILRTNRPVRPTIKEFFKKWGGIIEGLNK